MKTLELNILENVECFVALPNNHKDEDDTVLVFEDKTCGYYILISSILSVSCGGKVYFAVHSTDLPFPNIFAEAQMARRSEGFNEEKFFKRVKSVRKDIVLI